MALSGSFTSGQQGGKLKPADPTTIQNKFMVGYQGWFTCAGDGPPVGPGHHGWLHWFNYPIPDGGRPNTDLWPDMSAYSPSELYPAPGLKYATGEQAFLFSSRHSKTVQRHFHWMAEHGVDGAFLQRFAGQTDLDAGNEGIRNQRDEVGDRVREAAEKEGRVFAIMYDVSGVAPDRIQRVIEHDWMHLIHEKGVLDSPSYLRERGKAVVTLWGFGFADTGHDPATVRAITAFIRNNTPGGAYIMAGAPAHWRTSVSDADRNPEFVNVWLEEFDAISPWTIGRYHNEESADWFEKEKIKGDVDLINERNKLWEENRTAARKIDYIPVMFPGGSGHNLSEGKWGWNDAPRQGGRFMWRQLFNVHRHGVRTIYGAMWDEYDEGTAYLPVVSHKSQLPVLQSHNFMALDEDGYDLPPDWYMRICGFVAESLRGERIVHETFPVKELQDYWSTRPRYEKGPDQESGSGQQSYTEWTKEATKTIVDDDVPPPPYSLEPEDEESNPPEGLIGTSIHSSATPAPPVPPQTTRPHTLSIGSSISSASVSPSNIVPPSVNKGSRPAKPETSTPNLSHTTAPPGVDSLTYMLGRQSLTSESSGASHVEGNHKPSADSPYARTTNARSRAQSTWSSSSSSSGSSSSPLQTSWPPSGWTEHPATPPVAPRPYTSYPGQAYQTGRPGNGYGNPQAPGYAPGYVPNARPPPVPPRPSSHSPHPSSPQSAYGSYNPPASYSPQPPSPHPPHGSYHPPPSHGAYGTPPAGYRPPQQAAYLSSEHDAHFPQAHAPSQQNPAQPYPPYGGYYPQPPRQDPAQFPAPYAGPSYVYNGPVPGPPPPRPGSYPYAGRPSSPARPSLSSDPVGFASNLVQQGESQLQGIFETGSKLWNKRRM